LTKSGYCLIRARNALTCTPLFRVKKNTRINFFFQPRGENDRGSRSNKVLCSMLSRTFMKTWVFEWS